MKKKVKPAKNLSELYLLFIEDTLRDIKGWMKEWKQFTIQQINSYLTLPMLKMDNSKCE